MAALPPPLRRRHRKADSRPIGRGGSTRPNPFRAGCVGDTTTGSGRCPELPAVRRRSADLGPGGRGSKAGSGRSVPRTWPLSIQRSLFQDLLKSHVEYQRSAGLGDRAESHIGGWARCAVLLDLGDRRRRDEWTNSISPTAAPPDRDGTHFPSLLFRPGGPGSVRSRRQSARGSRTTTAVSVDRRAA